MTARRSGLGVDYGLVVAQIDPVRAKRDWLAVPRAVYAGDPSWIAPLDLSEGQRVNPASNPFFKDGEAAFFVATRGGAPVGRISAQVNHAHLRQQDDATGHFGFFDCVDDVTVAEALISAARGWLAARGLRRMLGPLSLSINQEVGLLVEGFDTPPAFMMGHARAGTAQLLANCGLTKAMDVLAYRLSPAVTPPYIERLSRLARESDRVRVRTFDMRRFGQQVRTTLDIFNDAWSDNWGFVPFSNAEVEHLIGEMRPIMRGKYGRMVDIDGEPAAMMIVLPDLNRVIAPFAGRLLPANWARLAHAVWRDEWKTARILLLGVRQAHRRTPLAASVLSLLVADFLELGRAYDLDWVELSWILETNTQMVKLAELAAGPPVKRYRLFEAPIA